MATDEKLDARQRIAKQLDQLLEKSTSDVTAEGFRMGQGDTSDFKEAGLSDAEMSKYITRKKRGLLAEEIKSADDPLGYVGSLKESDRMDELPGGVTRQQAERLAKLTKASRAGEQAAARARTPYQRPVLQAKIPQPMPRDSDKLSPIELAAAGFRGLGELKQMQEDREKGRGFTGLGKGTPLTTPAQRMRRAARMANRAGDSAKANQLSATAAAIDPNETKFFRSPVEKAMAQVSQEEALAKLGELKKKQEE